MHHQRALGLALLLPQLDDTYDNNLDEGVNHTHSASLSVLGGLILLDHPLLQLFADDGRAAPLPRGATGKVLHPCHNEGPHKPHTKLL